MSRLTRRIAVAGLAAAGMALLAGAAPRTAPVPTDRGVPGGPSFKSAKADAAPSARSTGAQIADRIDLSGQQGWMVVDLDSGRVLERHQAGRAFAPASVAKLPTAFYALETLGADFRFVTTVAAAGEIRDGRLQGDLALIGDGDPELDTDALGVLAQATAARIDGVSGRFLADATAGPWIVELDAGQPEDVTYNPAVTGLNLNFNRVRLEWDAAKGEDGLRMTALGERLNPPAQGFRVELASERGPVFDHDFAPGAEVWRMARHAFRGKGARWLPVRRPDLYAAQVFSDLAREKGLELPEAGTGEAPLRREVIAAHQSRPLTGVVKSMLKFSTNLTAEALGVRASLHRSGSAPETLYASAQRMNDWVADLAGFPRNSPDFRFANHSGLSTLSRVSPERMVALLTVIAARPPAASAPNPRIPGALSGLLKSHNIRDKGTAFDYANTAVEAKTGTMNYVRGLAGFIRTPKGRPLAFAYFANDIARRDASGPQTNKSWIARAQRLERALIRHWVRLADG